MTALPSLKKGKEKDLPRLLATWIVHYLNHIVQISHVMAKQYKLAVGLWIAYLGILQL